MSSASKGSDREGRVIEILQERKYCIIARGAASKCHYSEDFLDSLQTRGFEEYPRPDIIAVHPQGDTLVVGVTDQCCPARAKLKRYVKWVNSLAVTWWFEIWIAKKKKIGKKKWKYEFEIID